MQTHMQEIIDDNSFTFLAKAIQLLTFLVEEKTLKGVTGSLNEYWACQFYDGKLAHNGEPCDCLFGYSEMF